MNSKLVIGVLVVILLVAGGAYFLNMNNSEPVQTPEQNTETPTQSQPTPTSEQVEAAAHSVTIQNMAFFPATITINAGDSVTWTNQDSVEHTATADDGSFDTGLLGRGESNTVTFDTPGTYTYHCSPHPNMTATVIVE